MRKPEVWLQNRSLCGNVLSVRVHISSLRKQALWSRPTCAYPKQRGWTSQLAPSGLFSPKMRHLPPGSVCFIHTLVTIVHSLHQQTHSGHTNIKKGLFCYRRNSICSVARSAISMRPQYRLASRVDLATKQKATKSIYCGGEQTGRKLRDEQRTPVCG